jgi:SAM-dependent methyltransferase
MTALVNQPIPDYDSIADFYQKHWCSHYHSGLVAMLERYLLSYVRPPARILDLCCGTGKLAGVLASRGYRVTGVDSSPAMLKCAVQDVPSAEFLVRDARDFFFERPFDAAVCTFDSLSYFLTDEELLRVFTNVCQALTPGSPFAFDLSLEGAYKSEWNQTCSVIDDDQACFIRGSYDGDSRLGKTLITRFYQDSVWKRTDTVFLARCWRSEDILMLLDQAGFSRQSYHSSDHDEELRIQLGPSRAAFVAVR